MTWDSLRSKTEFLNIYVSQSKDLKLYYVIVGELCFLILIITSKLTL